MIFQLYLILNVGYSFQYDLQLPQDKRETAGELDIVHAIHTDITPDADNIKVIQDNKLQPEAKRAAGSLDIVNNDRAIHTDIRLDNDKVTPPKTFTETSLRKSYPISHTLDILRGVNRVVSLATLMTAAIIELCPILYKLYSYVY